MSKLDFNDLYWMMKGEGFHNAILENWSMIKDPYFQELRHKYIQLQKEIEFYIENKIER